MKPSNNLRGRTLRKKKEKCNLCGSTKFYLVFFSKDRMFDIPGKFRVMKCQKCGLVFLNPQPQKVAIKKYYPEDGYYSYQKSETEGFFGRLRRFLIFKYYGNQESSRFESPGFLIKALSVLIRKVPAIPKFKPGGRLLDIGCGSGKSLAQFKQLGWQTFGIETDKKAVNLAHKRGLKNVVQGSFEKLRNYPNSYFDVIRLYHVLEHLPDPALCLKLVYQKLKKGGQIIIGVPNIDSFAGKIFGRYWYNLDSPRHFFSFSGKTLRKFLKKSDFGIIKEDWCSGGGILGSFQYLISEKFKKKINLINQIYLFVLFYPLEWFLDKIKLGDVIILNAKK